MKDAMRQTIALLQKFSFHHIEQTKEIEMLREFINLQNVCGDINESLHNNNHYSIMNMLT